ncbi:MAG TPA: hypothetical protein VN200_04025 [Rhodoglobus sp.]|nr:hypothetical protein [Rhodoglobus sp.]
MDRFALLIVWVAFGLLLLVLMLLGWRALRRRQAAVPAPAARPDELGEAIAVSGGKYVATTAAGEPLQRIAVHGLGFRGDATAAVTDRGVLLALKERDVWIPAAELIGTGRATWTIDRVVEQDGLVTLGWRLGDREVETALRLDDPRAFEAAVQQLLPGRTAS